MSIQKSMTSMYNSATGMVAGAISTASGMVNAFKGAESVGAGIGKAAGYGAKRALLGRASVDFDREIGQLAMERVQAQTESKIPKTIEPDGGSTDGSETT